MKVKYLLSTRTSCYNFVSRFGLLFTLPTAKVQWFRLIRIFFSFPTYDYVFFTRGVVFAGLIATDDSGETLPIAQPEWKVSVLTIFNEHHIPVSSFLKTRQKIRFGSIKLWTDDETHWWSMIITLFLSISFSFLRYLTGIEFNCRGTAGTLGARIEVHIGSCLLVLLLAVRSPSYP